MLHAITLRFNRLACQRHLIGPAAIAALLVLQPVQHVVAQDLPRIKIMAPAAPGGGWDTTARAMQAVMMQSGVTRSVQVTNVPGAGGTIGLATLANNMRGDGTQLMVNGLVMVGAILTNKSAVDLSQVTPIARLTGDYEVIVVPAKSPVMSMKDLAAELKSNPKGVSIAGGSAGGTDHILAGMLVKAVGRNPAEVNYIPFSGGGEALAAMMGNHVRAGIGGYSEMSGAIRSGRVRPLAISSATRVPGIAIPTLKESGIDIEIANWRSVMAPPGLAPAQKAALIEAVGRMARSPQWKERLATNGWLDMYLSGDEFQAYLEQENKRVAEILRSIGLVK